MPACCGAQSGLNAKSEETIVIFGGTGRQGLSVAKNVVSLFPSCTVKIVSRGSPTSEKATAALEACGSSEKVSVVTANVNDKESLKPVLEGAYGVFLVTAFWPAEVDGGNGANQPLDPKYEQEGAMNVFEVAKECGVKHLIYSGLENTSKIAEFNKEDTLPKDANGYVVPHFDGKGECCEQMNEQDEMAVDFVFVGMYYGAMFSMKPQKGEDGEYAFYLPMDGKPNFMVDVEETGLVVAPLFNRLPKKSTKTLSWVTGKGWPVSGVIGCGATTQQIADAFSEVCLKGEKVKAVEAEPSAWAQAGIAQGIPEPVANDFANMFAYYHTADAIKTRTAGLAKSKMLAASNKRSKMTDLKAWLEKNKAALYPDVWAEGSAVEVEEAEKETSEEKNAAEE